MILINAEELHLGRMHIAQVQPKGWTSDTLGTLYAIGFGTQELIDWSI